jgi:hypothetical protein
MISRLTKVSKRLAEEYMKLYGELERDYQYGEPLKQRFAFYASQLNRAAIKKRGEGEDYGGYRGFINRTVFKYN